MSADNLENAEDIINIIENNVSQEIKIQVKNDNFISFIPAQVNRVQIGFRSGFSEIGSLVPNLEINPIRFFLAQKGFNSEGEENKFCYFSFQKEFELNKSFVLSFDDQAFQFLYDENFNDYTCINDDLYDYITSKIDQEIKFNIISQKDVFLVEPSIINNELVYGYSKNKNFGNFPANLRAFGNYFVDELYVKNNDDFTFFMSIENDSSILNQEFQGFDLNFGKNVYPVKLDENKTNYVIENIEDRESLYNYLVEYSKLVANLTIDNYIDHYIFPKFAERKLSSGFGSNITYFNSYGYFSKRFLNNNLNDFINIFENDRTIGYTSKMIFEDLAISSSENNVNQNNYSLELDNFSIEFPDNPQTANDLIKLEVIQYNPNFIDENNFTFDSIKGYFKINIGPCEVIFLKELSIFNDEYEIINGSDFLNEETNFIEKLIKFDIKRVAGYWIKFQPTTFDGPTFNWVTSEIRNLNVLNSSDDSERIDLKDGGGFVNDIKTYQSDLLNEGIKKYISLKPISADINYVPPSTKIVFFDFVPYTFEYSENLNLLICQSDELVDRIQQKGIRKTIAIKVD